MSGSSPLTSPLGPSGLRRFLVPLLILLTNSGLRSVGRNLGKLESADKANSAVPDASNEFANKIHCYSRPKVG
jgi:hypothetical protein